jgi:hypothetical protein
MLQSPLKYFFQIAVGANDPYVRVYDRRRLKAQLIEVSPVSDSRYYMKNGLVY